MGRDLPTIGLDELDGNAALLQRVERKYVAPRAVIDDVVAELAPSLRVLEVDGSRRFAYRSLYFDTADRLSYRLSLHGHRRRFKVRTRLYVDRGTATVEVKLKDGRGATVKHRRPHPADSLATLGADSVEWIDELIASRATVSSSSTFAPSVLTSYTRETLVESGTTRVTIDHDFTVSRFGELPRAYADMVVVETKATGLATATDRLLWRHGVRPLRISKFGVAVAICHPDLPANRWHRALQVHAGRGAAAE
jgi:hypothetical protein